jgi:hypothetical protein
VYYLNKILKKLKRKICDAKISIYFGNEEKATVCKKILASQISNKYLYLE